MLLVGLTGGIGSGKSTVAAGFAERGAAIVDADKIARQVVEPGGAAYDALVERFGPGILKADGHLDRQKMADVAFNDPDALAALNAITHPAIATKVAEGVAEALATHDVVVLDIPLLTVANKAKLEFGAVVVVDAPEDVAVERLVEHRGFKEADARARIAAQISREERRGLADYVIDNAGDRDALLAQVDRVWAALKDKSGAG